MYFFLLLSLSNRLQVISGSDLGEWAASSLLSKIYYSEVELFLYPALRMEPECRRGYDAPPNRSTMYMYMGQANVVLNYPLYVEEYTRDLQQPI